MGFLQASSSIFIFCAGLGLIICWTIASDDKNFMSNDCGGCIYLFHETISNAPEILKSNYYIKDSFYYLLISGFVCGLLFMFTACIADHHKYYMAFGIIDIVLFLCVFVTILEKVRKNKACKLYSELYNEEIYDLRQSWNNKCRSDKFWQLEHMFDSYEIGRASCRERVYGLV